MRTRYTWLNPRALLLANYLAGTVCGCASPAMSSHECCWMRRGWTVTMAMCKLRLLFVWTETSSAALNRLVTPARARANARLIAPSSVVPRPIREQARPAHPPNHSIENRRCDLFHKRPLLSDWRREGIETFGKAAAGAQKNGVRLHGWALLNTAGASVLLEPVIFSVGATAAPDDECSAMESSSEYDGFALIASGSAPEKPVASGWLSGWTK